MDIVAQRTKHVCCTSKLSAGSGDPSPHTTRGVLRGIQAACQQVLNRDKLVFGSFINGITISGTEKILILSFLKICKVELNNIKFYSG